jgi:glycosyltransferase involved in cell wall biosynthesis
MPDHRRGVTTPGERPAVLLIGNFPPPHGGVPRHIADLAPALVRAGFDVHVLSGGESGVDRRPGLTVHKVPRGERRRALLAGTPAALSMWHRHLRSFGLGELRHVSAYLSCLALARRIVRDHGIRLVKAYNVMSYGPVGAMLSRELGLPFVLASFGEYFKFPDFFSRHHDLVRFVVGQATVRVSMTSHCAEVYRRVDGGLPYELIPYGIDVSRFTTTVSGQAVRDAAGFSRDDQVVLYLARLTREMGLEVFLAAARALLARGAGLKFLIGGQEGELTAEAHALASAFPGSVFVRTGVPSEALPAWYAAADIVAVPSLDARACGSLSAAEASATGRPVVASRVGGVPEFVVDGTTGLLVPPGDAEALAAALATLAGAPDEARRLGLAGRVHAEAQLDVDRTNSRIEGLFRTLIAPPAARPG